MHLLQGRYRVRSIAMLKTGISKKIGTSEKHLILLIFLWDNVHALGRIKSGPLRQTPRSFSRLPESSEPGCRSIQNQINPGDAKWRRWSVFCAKNVQGQPLYASTPRSPWWSWRTRKAVLQYCSSGPQPANLCDPKIKTLQQLLPSKKKHHLSHSLVICELNPMDFETLAGATCGLAVPACLISQMMSNRTHGNVQLKYMFECDVESIKMQAT